MQQLNRKTQENKQKLEAYRNKLNEAKMKLKERKSVLEAKEVGLYLNNGLRLFFVLVCFLL